MNRSELIARARADLDQVLDGLLWAHTNGYFQTNATPEKKPATSTPRPDLQPANPTSPGQPGGPDHVYGPRHDIGIGSHRDRTALRASIGHLAKAEGLLQVAVYLAVGGRQPLAVRPGPDARPADITRCARGCRTRLALLANAAPAARADRLLDQAAGQLDQAWRRLKALDRGDTAGVATAEKPCKVCRIRPRADRKARCNTCEKWFQRNGYERPVSLDQGPVGEAKKAKARRAHRGEGWGDESYSAVGRWRELEAQMKADREAAEKKAGKP